MHVTGLQQNFSRTSTQKSYIYSKILKLKIKHQDTFDGYVTVCRSGFRSAKVRSKFDRVSGYKRCKVLQRSVNSVASIFDATNCTAYLHIDLGAL